MLKKYKQDINKKSKLKNIILIVGNKKMEIKILRDDLYLYKV
jgi:hypothetical protein